MDRPWRKASDDNGDAGFWRERRGAHGRYLAPVRRLLGVTSNTWIVYADGHHEAMQRPSCETVRGTLPWHASP